MAGPKYHIGARIHVNNDTSSRETSSHLLDNVLSIHAPIMIHVLDDQGRIVEVNRCWLEKMGYPVEQVVGRRISEFVTPSFRETAERDLAAIGTRESFMGLRRELITASGTIIEVEVDVRAIKDENIQELRLIGIAVDVTARNQREREIRAREEELRTLLDCAPDGIMIHIDGKYVYANMKAAEILGAHHPSEMLGKDALDVIVPSALQRSPKRTHFCSPKRTHLAISNWRAPTALR